MAENKVTLNLDNVSKSFAKVENDEVTHALNEISLTMHSGEFISLVGLPDVENLRFFVLWQD